MDPDSESRKRMRLSDEEAPQRCIDPGASVLPLIPIICMSCGNEIPINEAKVRTQFQRQIGRSLRSSTTINARKQAEDLETVTRVQLKFACGASAADEGCSGRNKTCYGCNANVTKEPRTHRIEADGLLFEWHCGKEHAVLIWYLLAGYDSNAKHNELTYNNVIRKPKGKENDSIPLYGPGVAYATAAMPSDFGLMAPSFYSGPPPHQPTNKFMSFHHPPPLPSMFSNPFASHGHALDGATPLSMPLPSPLPPAPFYPYMPTYNPYGVPAYAPPPNLGFGTVLPPLAKSNPKANFPGFDYGGKFAGRGHTLFGGPPAPSVHQGPQHSLTLSGGAGVKVAHLAKLVQSKAENISFGEPWAPPGSASAPINLEENRLPPLDEDNFKAAFLAAGFTKDQWDNEVARTKADIERERKAPKPDLTNGIGYQPEDDEDDEFFDYGADGDVEDHLTPPFDDGHPPYETPTRRGKTRYRTPSLPRQDPDDMLTTQTLAAVTALLPATEGGEMPANHGSNPGTKVVDMLSFSSLLNRVAELLRNDSLEDATRRGGLYEAALEFVKALASHSATSKWTVYTERHISHQKPNLLKQAVGKQELAGKKATRVKPLYTNLEGLATQSRIMLKRAQAKKEDFKDEEGRHMLFLCRMICDLDDFLQANKPQPEADAMEANNRNDSVITNRTSIDKDAWQKDLMVLEVSDDIILSTFKYKDETMQAANTAPGRMRKLAKEVTGFATGLPPGIFVRYGETRMDVMKVLIVGPKGTPYENGLWEFDLWCPMEYPNVAPKIRFRTTGGGIARVNPNLYEDGKVCLSLLGTWAGEQWRPGKSSLLQVLVSIQAMIFCDEPHCNEPACERDRGSEQSKDYNRRVYPMTVKHAMLEWLGKKAQHKSFQPRTNRGRTFADTTDPKQVKQATEALWGEVVKKHFEANKDDILTTVEKWTKDKSTTKLAPRFDLSFSAPAIPFPTYHPPLQASSFVGTGRGGTTLGGMAAEPHLVTGPFGQKPLLNLPKPETASPIKRIYAETARDGMVHASAKDEGLVDRLQVMLKELEKNAQTPLY